MAKILITQKNGEGVVLETLRGADLDFPLEVPADAEQSVKTRYSRNRNGATKVIDSALTSVQAPFDEAYHFPKDEDGNPTGEPVLASRSERYVNLAGSTPEGTYVIVQASEIASVTLMDDDTEVVDADIEEA